jgi:hypothetical protein
MGLKVRYTLGAIEGGPWFFMKRRTDDLAALAHTRKISQVNADN